ncbi:MAG: type IV pilus modification PilV family protein [Gemmatimonadaceae bacterium]
MISTIRRRSHTPAAPSRRRAGMTLIEVMVAMAILAGAMLGMGSFVVNFVREVSTTNIRATAGQLVAERLEQVKTASTYLQVDAYAGSESSIPGHPRYARQTLIKRVGGAASDVYDYKVVTVIVNAPGLAKPVRKTTVIAGF